MTEYNDELLDNDEYKKFDSMVNYLINSMRRLDVNSPERLSLDEYMSTLVTIYNTNPNILTNVDLNHVKEYLNRSEKTYSKSA